MEEQGLNGLRKQGDETVLAFDQHGRLLLNGQKVGSANQQSAGASDQVADVFMGMGYMKENCSPNAC